MPLTFFLQQLSNLPNFRLRRAITFSLLPFYLKSWCPSLSLQQLHIWPTKFSPAAGHYFPFYLKSWYPSRFPASSYLKSNKFFACGGPLLFPSPFLLKTWCWYLIAFSNEVDSLYFCPKHTVWTTWLTKNRNELTSKMTTLFACAHGVTSLPWTWSVAFQWVTLNFLACGRLLF